MARDARARWVLRAILYPLSSVLVFLPTGCNVGGVLAHKVIGPPPIPAQYVPAKEPTLVLVENYRNPSAAILDAQRLERRVADELERHGVAPVVDPDRLETVRSTPEFSKMTIPAVGRATQAKQVLYVNVHHFSIDGTVAGEMLKGRAEMSVRIVDAATGESRWPADAAGYAIAFETPWFRQGEGADEGALREQMSRRAADTIVKLFRKHSAEEGIEGAVQ
jgi:hypothetical protein